MQQGENPFGEGALEKYMCRLCGRRVNGKNLLLCGICGCLVLSVLAILFVVSGGPSVDEMMDQMDDRPVRSEAWMRGQVTPPPHPPPPSTWLLGGYRQLLN